MITRAANNSHLMDGASWQILLMVLLVPSMACVSKGNSCPMPSKTCQPCWKIKPDADAASAARSSWKRQASLCVAGSLVHRNMSAAIAFRRLHLMSGGYQERPSILHGKSRTSRTKRRKSSVRNSTHKSTANAIMLSRVPAPFAKCWKWSAMPKSGAQTVSVASYVKRLSHSCKICSAFSLIQILILDRGNFALPGIDTVSVDSNHLSACMFGDRLITLVCISHQKLNPCTFASVARAHRDIFDERSSSAGSMSSRQVYLLFVTLVLHGPGTSFRIASGIRQWEAAR